MQFVDKSVPTVDNVEQPVDNIVPFPSIYDNCQRRGIWTVADAVENEYRWNRGEILA